MQNVTMEYMGRHHKGRCRIVGTQKVDRKSVVYTCKITRSDIPGEIGKDFEINKSKFIEDWKELK